MATVSLYNMNVSTKPLLPFCVTWIQSHHTTMPKETQLIAPHATNLTIVIQPQCPGPIVSVNISCSFLGTQYHFGSFRLNLTVTHAGCTSCSVTTIPAKIPVQIEMLLPINQTKDSATKSETEEDWLQLQQGMLKQLKCDQAQREKEASCKLPIG